MGMHNMHRWLCTHTEFSSYLLANHIWPLGPKNYQDIRMEPGHRVCRLPICIRLTPALLSFSPIHLSSHRTVYLTLSYGWSGVREDWPMHEFLHIKFYIPLLVRKHQESTVGRHRPSFWRYNFITASVIGDTSAQFHKCFVIEWLRACDQASLKVISQKGSRSAVIQLKNLLKLVRCIVYFMTGIQSWIIVYKPKLWTTLWTMVFT